MDRVDRSERPYLRYAFLNPYNLTLFLAGLATGFLTGHHWLVVLTCGAEALWLIFAPDSTILQRLWFDRSFDTASRIEREEDRKERIARLSPNDVPRVARLLEQKQLIERLASDNPSLAVDLLQTELVKLDALLDDFVELGVAAGRSETHSLTFDFDAMRRSWYVHDRQVKAHPIGDRRREVAEKNLDVLRRRRARYDELVRQLQVLRGQMELIEQTFRLLADEILTMGSPRELGGRIDELRIAVDAVRETAGDSYDCEASLREELEAEEEIRHEAAR